MYPDDIGIMSSHIYAQLRDVQSIYYVIREYGCHLGPVSGTTTYSSLSLTTYFCYYCIRVVAAAAAAVAGCAAAGCMAVLLLVISAGKSKQRGLVRRLTENAA